MGCFEAGDDQRDRSSPEWNSEDSHGWPGKLLSKVAVRASFFDVYTTTKNKLIHFSACTRTKKFRDSAISRYPAMSSPKAEHG